MSYTLPIPHSIIRSTRSGTSSQNTSTSMMVSTIYPMSSSRQTKMHTVRDVSFSTTSSRKRQSDLWSRPCSPKSPCYVTGYRTPKTTVLSTSTTLSGSTLNFIWGKDIAKAITGALRLILLRKSRLGSPSTCSPKPKTTRSTHRSLSVLI